MQHGGRLIGQGVYGCAFEPMPRCAGGQVLRQIAGMPVVGKITVEDAGDEVGIGRIVMALPMAKAYFAAPTATCRPEMPINDPDVASCKVLTDEGRTTRLSMLMMPAAGQQLLRWSMNKTRLADQYMRLFVHLLEGMILYQGADVIHNDIHMGNILLDDRDVARYIDFGLAFRVGDVKVWDDANLGRSFRPKYIWQAPEVHAMRMVFGGVRIQDGVRQLKEINPEYGQLEMQYPGRPSAEVAIRGIVEKYGKSDGVALVRQYAKQFDAWRIGLCMWFLWQDLLVWSGFRQTALWAERDRVRAVLGGLTEFDPARRWTAARALATLDPTNRLGMKA
jgi:hypothetical protein